MQTKRIESYKSEKNFQVWDALVSHQHFLLRNSATDNESENIDLIFQGTTYLEIPTLLKGLVISEINEPETVAAFSLRTGLEIDNPKRLFALKSADKTFYIVASQVLIHTNTLDVFASPLRAVLGIDEAEINTYRNKLTAAFRLV